MLGTLAQWPPVRLVRSVLARSAEDDVSTHAYQLFLSTLGLSLVALSVYGLVVRVTAVPSSATIEAVVPLEPALPESRGHPPRRLLPDV